jgi:DNA-binding beta-propeller fold protein YncE
VRLAPGQLLAVGGGGRALTVDLAAGVVATAIGSPDAAPSAQGRATFAPLLGDAAGAALDPTTLTLVIAEQDTGDLRVIGLDADDDGALDDAAAWTHRRVATALVAPAGLAWEPATGAFLVADEGAHCVRRVDVDGSVVDTGVGVCGQAGGFLGWLSRPRQVAVSPTSGAVYVADAGNHRVVRVDVDGSIALVTGTGSASSAGDGRPARGFPVDAPGQLVVDPRGNLFVASTTTVRLVANVGGDADADGDDAVLTIYGGGDRAGFPEATSLCIDALALDDDAVFVADRCQGFLLGLHRTAAVPPGG